MRHIRSAGLSFVVLAFCLCIGIDVYAQKSVEEIQRILPRQKATLNSERVDLLDDEEVLTADIYGIPEPIPCGEHCVKKTLLRVRLHANGLDNLYRMNEEDYEVVVEIMPIAKDGTTIVPVLGGPTRILSISRSGASINNECVAVFDLSADHPQQCPIEERDARDKYGIQIIDKITQDMPIGFEAAFRVEVELIEEYTDKPVAAVLPSEPNVSVVPSVFSWAFDECEPGFPAHEVQILRLYNTDEEYSNQPLKCKTKVDWNQALSIPIYGEPTTPSITRELSLTLAEGTGYYLWRVRSIGNEYENPLGDSRNWGPWSSAPDHADVLELDLATVESNLEIVNDLHPNAAFYYEQFDHDKNWYFDRVYAEGKDGEPGIIEKITYATATLTPIQTQTSIMSTDDVMLSQSIPDYHGRPTLATLPYIKVRDGSIPASLVYVDTTAWKSELYTNAFSNRFTAEQFDGSTSWNSPLQMYGAIKHYWDANPNPTVGSTQGYPYSQVSYHPDPLNRVREQSNVSVSLKVGSTHTVRTDYASVTDAELITIFGNEAPSDTSVTKTITTDQNGVVSVAYALKDGKTIATCLVNDGITNAPLVAIPNTYKGDINDVVAIDTIQRGILNGSMIEVQQEFILVKATNVTFEYDLVPSLFQTVCMNMCQTCDYAIEITVRNVATQAIAFSHTSTVAAGECPVGEKGNHPTPTTSELPAGKYVVTRRLYPTTGTPAIESYKEELTTTFTSATETLLGDIFGATQVAAYRDSDPLPNESIYEEMLANYNSYRSSHASLASIDCCSLDLPAAQCTTGCDEAEFDYEADLVARCSTEWVASMKVFNSEGVIEDIVDNDNSLTTANGDTPRAYFLNIDGTPFFGNHTTGENNGVGKINAMIASIIANSGYTCKEVWACWTSVTNPKVLRTAGWEPHTVGGEIQYYKPRLGFSLLNYLVDCLGVKYCELADADERYTDDAWMLNVWSKVPISDVSSPNLEEDRCKAALGYRTDEEDTLWHCGRGQQSDLDVYYNYAQLRACLQTVNANEFLGNRIKDMAAADAATDEYVDDEMDEADIAAKFLEKETDCKSICDTRRDKFRDGIIKAYLDEGYYIEGVSEFVDPTPTPSITQYELACAVQNLIEQCKADCQLTPVTFDAMTGLITSPTIDQLKLYQAASTSASFRISIPASEVCPDNFRFVERDVNKAAILVELLNTQLGILRFALGLTGATDDVMFDVKAGIAEIESRFGELTSCTDAVPTFQVIVKKKVGSRFVLVREGESCKVIYRTDPEPREVDDDPHALVTMLNKWLFDQYYTKVPLEELDGLSSLDADGDATVYLYDNSHWDLFQPAFACDHVYDPQADLEYKIEYCDVPMPCINGKIGSLTDLQDILKIYTRPTAGIKLTSGSDRAQVLFSVLLDACGQKLTIGASANEERVVVNFYENSTLVKTNEATFLGSGNVFTYVPHLLMGQGWGRAYGYPLGGYFREHDGRLEFVITKPPPGTDEIVRFDCINLECELPRAQECLDVLICDDCAVTQCAELCFRWVPADTVEALFELGQKSCAQMEVERLMNLVSGHFSGICLPNLLQEAEISYKTNCWQPDAINDKFLVQREESYYHYTLYYYDRAGNLTKTVPPKGVHPLVTPNVKRTEHPAHAMITRYAYNTLGQLIKQQTPDGGVTEFWYNAAGQLRVSRNAKQAVPTTPLYTVTDYDDLGRPMLSGEIASSAGGQALADAVTALTGATDLTVTTYSTMSTLPAPYTVGVDQRYLLNRVSSAYTDVDGADPTTPPDRVTTHYSYDPHGNVEWVIHEIPGMDAALKIDYEYDLISGKVLSVAHQRGYPDQFFVRYTYDLDQRLATTETSRDEVIWERDASYSYLAHGPMHRTELGQDKVNGVDYVYTVHGWLKAINHPSFLTTMDPGADGTNSATSFPEDAFGMILRYYGGEFFRPLKPVTPPTNPATYEVGPYLSNDTWAMMASPPLYDGNITGWSSNGRENDGDKMQGLADVYTYDRLSRLTKNIGWLRNTATTPPWIFPPTNGVYGSSYNYDPNGNIKILKRYDASGANIDDLTYTYESSDLNRLKSVDDATSAASSSFANDLNPHNHTTNYAYDAIGNLTQDLSQGIPTLGIEWTPNNKIRSITNATYEISYLYDAGGNRVRQVRDPIGAGDTKTTFYGRVASGKNTLSVYEQIGTGDVELKEATMYGTNRLGLMRFDIAQSTTALTTPVVYDRFLDIKDYEISDHLGNVRHNIGDRTIEVSAGNYRANVLMHTDYFPFGMQREGRSESVAGYRYGFNGKEIDNDVKGDGNQIDFGARAYDPRVSRWLSIDPLQHRYPDLSAYTFAANTPIQAKDPDGRVVIFINGQHSGSGGSMSYWQNFDVRLMARIGDQNARYVDGAMGGWANTKGWFDKGMRDDPNLASQLLHRSRAVAQLKQATNYVMNQSNVNQQVREADGYAQGLIDAKGIIENLSEGETIKIVTHSLGSAWARGYIRALQEYKNGMRPGGRIAFILDVNAFGGDEIQSPKNIPLFNITGGDDGKSVFGSLLQWMINGKVSVTSVGPVAGAKNITSDQDMHTAHDIGTKSVEGVPILNNGGTIQRSPIEQGTNNGKPTKP